MIGLRTSVNDPIERNVGHWEEKLRFSDSRGSASTHTLPKLLHFFRSSFLISVNRIFDVFTQHSFS
jgi:hypothetical protein